MLTPAYTRQFERDTKKAACIAILGTGSDVGKSIVVTAFCRILADRGVRVAPFKAQNMSNNSGVTLEGLEMGRAQIVQAEAARIVPHVDMNPVLLKPTSEMGAQVVLNGVVLRDASAKAYHRDKDRLFVESRAALDRLRNRYDVVVMEGAGSCAEVNLMPSDIVNLRMAAYAEAPVIVVADIDRGGVFAQIVGTLACLPPPQQAQIRGFIVNRFRGDIDLFKDGAAWIAQKTGKPVFGVLPWFSRFKIEAEDAVTIQQVSSYRTQPDGIPAVAVIKLPHISNFTDFDPLARLDGLQLVYLEDCQPLEGFSAVILPGSKSTRIDLGWLHHTGWTASLQRYAASGGHLLGICGGYQMLGRAVHDPRGVEGTAGSTPGLDLLPVETELNASKTTTLTDFTWEGIPGRSYEIHMGRTELVAGRPLLTILRRNQIACNESDGCIGSNEQVLGTYLHGLFDTPEITRHWLQRIGLRAIQVSPEHGQAARDAAYDMLAEHTLQHIDMPAILSLARI
ncbi:MAG: cobyric acid synthase [Desulfosarcina sp.]